MKVKCKNCGVEFNATWTVVCQACLEKKDAANPTPAEIRQAAREELHRREHGAHPIVAILVKDGIIQEVKSNLQDVEVKIVDDEFEMSPDQRWLEAAPETFFNLEF